MQKAIIAGCRDLAARTLFPPHGLLSMRTARRSHEPSRWQRYGVAVGATAIAVVFHLPFHPLLAGKLSFLLFALAVMVSGWYGGLEGGLVCAALGITAWGTLLWDPRYALRFRHGNDYLQADLAQLALFLPVSIGISLLAEALHRDRQRLREASAAKDRFLATLSHELRTPLTPAILALSASQGRADLPPGLAQDLELARAGIEMETRLIDDLLDVTRIGHGKLVLKQEAMDAHLCLRHAVEICHAGVEAKRLRLELDLRATSTVVNADPTRLQQVFWNLLNNATKFTPEGGTITVRTYNRGGAQEDPVLAKAAGPPRALVIEVRDTGIGMEPSESRSIFAPFRQADGTIARRFGGLGLGLAICKSLVEMHGGAISASSLGRNQGAVFTVTLPTVDLAARSVVASPDLGPDERPLSDGHKLRILLVEDHADTRRLLSRLLRGAGHWVRTAGSVGEGLAAADAERFDLLVSDLGLPDGSGCDLVRQLKRQYGLIGIALSGYGMDEDVVASKAAGFVEHLIKPVSFRRLSEVIDRLAAAAAHQPAQSGVENREACTRGKE